MKTKEECAELLAQATQCLQTLNQGTENAFLTLGGQLADFLSGIRQIRSDMTTLRAIVSAKTSSQAPDVLSRVLESSRHTDARAQAGDQVLVTLAKATTGIKAKFGGFEGTVAAFRTLGSSTRIEIGRLGSSGSEFGNIAEEVNVLTKNIEFHGQSVVNDFTNLHQGMQAALAGVSSLREGGLKELPSLEDKIASSLESLDEQRRRADSASVKQAAEYEQVTLAVEDLIPAIQFHDITRQQVEHVVSALTRLRSDFHEFPEDTPDVLALQSLQLANAEQIFVSSVGRIEQDLINITERVANMAEQSKTIWGGSPDGQGAFFLQMEQHLLGILKILGACADAEAQTIAVLTDLQATVTRAHSSIEEVRKIGSRIRRVAFNLVIRAVQIGDAGNVLGVLADVMKRVALDAIAIADDVAESLTEIAAAAAELSLSAQLAPATERRDSTWAVSEIHAYVAELRLSSDDSLARVNQIGALSNQLCERIRKARAGLSVSTVFSTEVSRSRLILQELARHVPTRGSGDADADQALRLARFAEQYTMTAERDVHAAVTSGFASAPLALSGSPVNQTDEESLLESVDFF